MQLISFNQEEALVRECFCTTNNPSFKQIMKIFSKKKINKANTERLIEFLTQELLDFNKSHFTANFIEGLSQERARDFAIREVKLRTIKNDKFPKKYLLDKMRWECIMFYFVC